MSRKPVECLDPVFTNSRVEAADVAEDVGMTEALAMKKRVSLPLPYMSGPRRRPSRVVALALLALGTQTGCGREFFREWANQDVSEAVFEKSRDPRWRMDLFTISPPAKSRFAQPYDPDRLPAPPDDFPTEKLSPVPQNPVDRLITPTEGTGYLDILGETPRYESPKPRSIVPPRLFEGTPGANPPTMQPPPALPLPGNASPFTPAIPGPGASSGNSGPKPPGLSPTSLAKGANSFPANPTTRTGERSRPVAPVASNVAADQGVQRTSMQDPANPMPKPPANNTVDNPQPSSTTTDRSDPVQTPKIAQDPLPVDTTPAAERDNPPIKGMSPKLYQEVKTTTANLAAMFLPEDIPFDEAVAGGLPTNSKPYVVTMEKAFQLAILNSRYYQFQLEAVYLNALPVTLQRFSFSPQYIAGLTPITAPSGLSPTDNPSNSFLYNTRATGSQVSTLNYGTVAGVGKLFDNGTRVLASFATSVVFNFVGKNPAQPTTKSFIPIQAVVPFLRGGGRALTLEALTQAERNLVYSVRSFAKFRQEFVTATLTGGSVTQFGTNVVTTGFSTGGNVDPTTGFLNVVEDVQLLENQVKNLLVFEKFAVVYAELIKGEASGLSQLQLDQIRQQVQQARSNVLQARLTYRNDLDQFKYQLGMPPDTPMIIDRSRTAGFKRIFEDIDKWALSANREMRELTEIVGRLPKLENVIIDGRSCLGIFSEDDDRNLEDLLLTAERVALENRLDLMNARGQLYDAWRQIRFTANALKGVLNVAVTNQFITPPTTNNPFGFVDQAKQFSLVINAELPLVRVAERNNFVTALINYERQRRTLQSTEDFLKYQLRSEIRQMQYFYQQYSIAQKNLILSVKLKDQAFETIIAPPAASAGGNQAPLQTTNLIQFQTSVVNNENNLVSNWYQFQLYRLQVYRDLGILPFDEWEAFDEIFPPDRSGGNLSAAVNPDGRPTVTGPTGPTPPVAVPR